MTYHFDPEDGGSPNKAPPVTQMTQTELLLRDSLQIETAKTARELDYIVRNIEARHAVEGIGAMDLAAWENVKRQHIERVYRVVTA